VTACSQHVGREACAHSIFHILNSRCACICVWVASEEDYSKREVEIAVESDIYFVDFVGECILTHWYPKADTEGCGEAESAGECGGKDRIISVAAVHRGLCPSGDLRVSYSQKTDGSGSSLTTAGMNCRTVTNERKISCWEKPSCSATDAAQNNEINPARQ
jgi:hypothetical protein